MYKTALRIETTARTTPSISEVRLDTVSRESLTSLVRQSVPPAVMQRLRRPTSSSVPLIVCSYPRNSAGANFTNALALYSRLECEGAGSYEAMCADVMLLPHLVYNGEQLGGWFAHNIEIYYARSVTRRLTAEGEPNVNYDPSLQVQIPVAEFSAPSLEESYARLVCAIADLDDDGEAKNREVDQIAAATRDAVTPAGVQFIHLDNAGETQTCFVSLTDLIEDAKRFVMF